jgi:DNA-binding response OmpR family regulator
MADERKKILWADDEMDHLRPHVKFLEDRGFSVSKVTNGEDAIALASEPDARFDLVILDEMMPGIDGLETLAGIKERDPYVPVIMVTKSEEEALVDEAIRGNVDNYLVKPVNPLQVYTAAKRLLEGERIRESGAMRDYVADFTVLRNLRSDTATPDTWIDVYRKLVEWDVRLDEHRDAGLLQTHEDAKLEANIEFCRFVSENYRDWVKRGTAPEDRPTLSTDIVPKYVAPLLKEKRKVYFIIIDCLRLDQWVAIEKLLEPYFDIRRDHYYSILPTATSFARNSIFSGLLPLEIAKTHPEFWSMPGDDDSSLNRHERQFLDAQLDRLGIRLNPTTKYIKVFNQDEAGAVKKDIASLYSLPLVAMVFNFVDILSHGRSESEILQEIAPDEAAFRALTTAWFKHSSLFDILKAISKQDATVVLSTDHGSVLSRRSTIAYGNRDTSTNLRFKIGTNLGCDEKNAVHLKNPEDFQLPSNGLNTHYILAKENYYFVYPTKFHEYERQYRGSFQHGGISMEEMLLPCVVMNPRR